MLSEKLLSCLREGGVIESRVIAGQENIGAKFSDYFGLLGPYSFHSAPPRAGAAPRQRRRRGTSQRWMWHQPPCGQPSAGRAEAEAAAENMRTSVLHMSVKLPPRYDPRAGVNTVDDEDRVLGWLGLPPSAPHGVNHMRPRLAERIRHQLLDTAAQNATEVFASTCAISCLPHHGHKTTLGLDLVCATAKYAVVDGTGEPPCVGTGFTRTPRATSVGRSPGELCRLARASTAWNSSPSATATASRNRDKLASELIRTLREEGGSTSEGDRL